MMSGPLAPPPPPPVTTAGVNWPMAAPTRRPGAAPAARRPRAGGPSTQPDPPRAAPPSLRPPSAPPPAPARADDGTTQESDVRAVAAILYCALTGHWPREGGTKSQLPDAVRVDGDRVAAPRQVRAGVPGYLDELTVDLLNPDVPLPTAAELAA